MLKKQGRKKIFILLLFLFLNISIFYSHIPTVGALANTKLAITPATQTVNSSTTFYINVYCTPTRPVKGFELELTFNPSLIKATKVTEGDFFDPYETFFNDGDIDNANGKITNIFGLILGPGNISSPGSFIKVIFTAKTTSGTSKISFSSVGEWTGITDEYGYLPISVTNGNVIIIGGSGDTTNPGGGGGEITVPTNPMDNNQENTPPTISNNLSGPTQVITNIEYYYTIKAYDKEGKNITIMFNWDNGTYTEWSEYVPSNTTVTMPHTYKSVSTHTLKALAQDENGMNSTWSNTLTINVFSPENTNNSINPEITVNYTEKANQNQTIIFNASKSQNNSINITKYSWNFGDKQTTTGNPVEHKYKEPGIYNVTLTMTDSNNNTYIKQMIITITKSDIEAIKKGENNKENNNSNLFLGFLLIITIAIPIISYIFIYQKNTKDKIITFIKKITTIIYVYAKKTKDSIFSHLKKIITFISSKITKIKKPTKSSKKLGIINFFTKKSIENIDKKIEKISTNIHSTNHPSFITDPETDPYYNYKLRDITVLKEDSYHNEKILDNFFNNKSKNLKTGDKISKLYKKLFKTYKSKLENTKTSEIDFKIDKILDKTINKIPTKKDTKNDFINYFSKDDIDDIVDEIIKSRHK